jgi:DnaJ family protein C protein 19
MIFLFLAAAAAAWWYWGRALSRQQLIAAASGLAGLFLLLKGQWQIAIPMFLPAVWMLVQPPPARAAPPAMEIAEARRILGVGPEAGPDEIRAAHRKLVARVHPDQGGSAELATRVNMARDLLLAEQRRG